MRYLVDTNGWIGFLEGERGFGRRAREIMLDEPWECQVSLASVWDRIQIIQARHRKLDILSRDQVFDRCGLRRVW